MRFIRHQQGEIFGIVLCVVLALSVYAGFVGVVSELFGHDFIETISLSSQVHSKDDYRFAMGDTMIVSAKVKGSNVYRLNVYDNSDRLVFEDVGAVNGSDVKVSVPILPPAFDASRVYELAFDAGLVNYPLPGIDAYGSSAGAFAVVKSSTRLNLTANYDAVSHELQAVAFLTTNDTLPVQNKTVSLYMQPDLDLPRNDKGWICIGQRQTDENGVALFYVAVNGRGGACGLKARFAGDDDFGASKSLNATSFVAVSPTPCLRVAEIERVKNTVTLVFRVTNEYGFPLGGRLLSFEPLSLGRGPLYAISDGTGCASITLNVGGLLSFVDSRISVLGDAYTSRLQVTARLNLTGSKPFFEQVSGAEASEGLLSNEESKDSTKPRKASTSSLVMFASIPTVSASLIQDPLPMSVSLDQNPAVADLPETVSVDFATTTYPDEVQFQFYRNGTDNIGNTTAYCRKYRMPNSEGDGYLYWWDYSGTLVWYPDYYGGCNLTVNAVDVNNTIVAQGSSGSFSISPAPVNLVVYYPMTFCGGALDLSVALSRSRVYGQSGGSGFFQSSTLAPNLQWVGNTYMLDCGDNSTLIEVYLNGSRSVVVPDSQGFARVQASLGVLGSSGALNVTAHINATSRFKEVFVYSPFIFTQTSVSDVPSAGSDDFALNYSLDISDCGERTYVDVQNSVNVSAYLFGLPVYNASASVVTARLVSRSATNSSGWAAIPPGCNYLRVKSACKLTQGMASPLADVDGDGSITVGDFDFNGTYGSSLGDSRFDWRFDLNGDGKIDQADLDIVNSSFGNTLNYYTNYNYSAARVDFDNGQKAYLDSRGFVSVPSVAQWLNMSIGGIVEFFVSDTAQSVSTDNLGIASANWSPGSLGLYVVQARLPSKFNVTWSCDIAQLAHVDASLNVANYFYVLKRPVDFNINLQVPLNHVVVSAVGHVTQQPVSSLPINITVNTVTLPYDTNQSGVVVECWPFDNIVYNITVSCADCGDNAASAASRIFDLRLLANLTSQPGNSVAYANLVKTLYFDLFDNCSHEGLSGVSVDLYINGTYYSGTSPQVFTNHTSGTTLWNGTVVFNWNVPNGNGTYSLSAVFNGSTNYCPCQVCDTVTVKSVPLGVLFSVTPTEFKPADSVLLNATVIDASTNTLFTGQNVNVKFIGVSSAGSSLIVGSGSTGSTGIATLSVTYPNDGTAYAYKAEIVPDYAGGNLHQGIASSPIRLTVASPTVLLLNVSRDYNSTRHVVEGWLKSSGAAVFNRTVTVSLNGTRVFSGSTDSNGHFSFTRDLQPRNPQGQPTCESATYTIEADFAGDTAVNATAYSNMLDGTTYPACTTVQYGYKPCSNSTVLTVNPQSTQALQATKSPEEMQKEAQQSGWLSTYNEFSWWYPWYRLHFVGKYNGETMIDVGIGTLPFADTGFFPDTQLKSKTDEWFTKVLWNVIQGVVATEFAMWAGSHFGPIYFLAVVGVYVGYKLLNLHLNWNSLENLYISLVSTFTSLAISVWTGLCSFLPANLRALAASAESIKNLAFAFLCKIIMIPLNIFLLMMTWNQIVALGGV